MSPSKYSSHQNQTRTSNSKSPSITRWLSQTPSRASSHSSTKSNIPINNSMRNPTLQSSLSRLSSSSARAKGTSQFNSPRPNSTQKRPREKVQQQIISLLDDEEEDNTRKKNKSRFSMDSHVTQSKQTDSFFTTPNKTSRHQTPHNKTPSSLRIHSHSKFGLLRLAPISPHAFSHDYSTAHFEPTPINPSKSPIPLKEQGILGRSIELHPSRRKRKSLPNASNSNKIDLEIPITANGISRKQIQVTKIKLYLNESEAKHNQVIFQVMNGVKNDFFIVKNEKWHKPEGGETFSLRVGDCIVFDIYEWRERKCAKYGYQLVLYDDTRKRPSRPPQNVEIIQIDEDVMDDRRKRQRTTKTKQTSIEPVDISMTEHLPPYPESRTNHDDGPNFDFLTQPLNQKQDDDQRKQESISENGLPEHNKSPAHVDMEKKKDSTLDSELPAVKESKKEKCRETEKVEPQSTSKEKISKANIELQDNSIKKKDDKSTNGNKKDDCSSSSQNHVCEIGQKITSVAPTCNARKKNMTKQISNDPITSDPENDKIKQIVNIKTTCTTDSSNGVSKEDHTIAVFPEDQEKITEYMYFCLSHLRFCYSPKLNKAGLECAYCEADESKRKPSGFRVFPTSSRTLRLCPNKTHEHLLRCSAFPEDDLDQLKRLESSQLKQYTKIIPHYEDEFFDNLWKRFQEAQAILKGSYESGGEVTLVKSNRFQEEKETKLKKKPIKIKKEKSVKSSTSKRTTTHTSLKSKSVKIKQESGLYDDETTPNISVGDRIAVKLEGPELFKTPKRTRIQWYFGTVLSIDKTMIPLELSVEYDDKVKDKIKFPDEDVTKLKDIGGGIMCADEGCMDGKGVGYSSPKDLCVGDLVDARYKNREKWFRGRVAAVDWLEKICEVAYDDGDYEQNIPIDFNNIRFIKSGWESHEWMIGLSVELCNRNKELQYKIVARNGPDVEAAHMGDVTFDLFHLSSKHGSSSKRLDYIEVARKIFTLIYEEAKKKNRLIQWRSDPYISEETKRAGKPSIIKDEGSDDPSTMLSSSCSWDNNNIVSPNASPIQEKNIISQSSSSDDLSSEEKAKGPLHMNDKDVKEMVVNQSNSLWRALSSTEPQSGYGILTQAAIVYRTIPNQYLSKNLYDSLVNGLKSEGIRLVDPNKTELTSRYAYLMANNFSGSVCGEGTRYKVSCCKWTDVENCLSQTTDIAKLPLRQVTDRLLEASNAIEYLSTLLENDKAIMLKMKKEDSLTRQKFKNQCQIMPSLFDCPGGVRGALKCSVKNTGKSWIQFGPEIISSCALNHSRSVAVSRYLNALGRITSLIAWMFCVEEDMDMKDKKCSFLIRDAFLSDMMVKTKGSKDQQLLRDIKLSFILSFKADHVEDLKTSLAVVFDLKDEYEIIMGM